MASFFNNHAAQFAKQPIKDIASWEDTLSRIRLHLAPTSTVLEVGCGTGTVASKLAPACAEILCTDVAPNMIRIAEEKVAEESVDNCKFQVADAANPPEGEFDVVLALNVINLCEYPSAVLRVLRSRLKPGGIMVCKIHKVAFNWWQRLTLPVMQFFGKMPQFIYYFDLPQLVQLHEKLGFDVIDQVEYKTTPHCLVIARKNMGADV